MNHVGVHEDDWLLSVDLDHSRSRRSTACGAGYGTCVAIIIGTIFGAESDGRAAAKVEHRSRFVTQQLLDLSGNKHVFPQPVSEPAASNGSASCAI
jgi:hypothetical protein